MPRWLDWLIGRGSFAAQPVAPAPAPEPERAPRPRRGSSLQAAAINVSELQRQEGNSSRVIQSLPWQMEAWEFYDELGEFRFGVTWKSEMMSRIRLRAAKLSPDSDEPEIQESGPAVDVVSELAGGIGGQSEMISTLSVFLSVPGEGYLIGETKNTGKNVWQARSIDEVKQQSGRWSVLADNGTNKWRELPSNHLVWRVYRPHKRYRAMADSPARAATKAMRELELVNRHIQAQYLSRLASAGIVVFPEGVTFPVREEFQDAPDPFVREWVEIAAEAIRTPGTAAAIVPIPMRLPDEMVEKVKHIDFTLKMDEKIIEKRESVIKRLATQLDLPAEILLGMGDLNHWTSWQIEESAVKTHITPDMEVICYALTDGYLRPRLKAAGVPDPEQWVVWYDASEITLRPDRSENARDAYDRHELSGKAYRREIGFDEDDAPNEQELEEQMLKKLSREASTGMAAVEALTGRELVAPAEAGTDAPNTDEPEDEEPAADGPPDTRDVAPPSPDSEASANKARLHQSGLMHTVRFNIDGSWELLHPSDCWRYLHSCPVTYATRHGFPARPGKSGLYECYLTSAGRPTIGRLVPNTNTHDLIKSNGHGAHQRS